EGRALPFVEGLGRLNVVVVVKKKRRRLIGGSPVGRERDDHGGMGAFEPEDFNGPAELRHPLLEEGDRLLEAASGRAHARNRQEVLEPLKVDVKPLRNPRTSDASARHIASPFARLVRSVQQGARKILRKTP